MSAPLSLDGPHLLSDVAEHFLIIHDDLIDSEEEFGEVLSDDEVLEIIRRNYVSGTCQAFAIALHDHLGLPLVNLMGGLHVAVQCSDGHLMDFMGTATLDEMSKRYGWKKKEGLITPSTRDDVLDQMGQDDEDLNDSWGDLTLAHWVRQHLDRWSAQDQPLAEATLKTGSKRRRCR
jgi:hypothetical protein